MSIGHISNGLPFSRDHNLRSEAPSGPNGFAPSRWCDSACKRGFDLACASVALVILAPLMLLIAGILRTESSGPALFRHTRLGKGGRPFAVFKFRTMRASQAGLDLTCMGDGRVTAVGRLLRKSKLDELPQLVNVVRGEMSLVGPRPDVAKYLFGLPSAEQCVLQLRPGITSPASIRFRHEEEILATAPGDPETYYVHEVLPQKVRLELEYSRRATFLSDLRCLFETVRAVLH